MLRRLLLLAALLAFSGIFAAAEAKTLRMAYDADPTSLDPHEQLASATLQLSHLTFDPLLRFRQDLTLEPRLAKSWEKIDERTTRFHKLRDQPPGDRRQDHARLRHAGRRAQSAGLCRL